MAKNKTVETDASVAEFLKTVKDETRRKDCQQLVAMIRKQTGMAPRMWGPSLVGFGSYHYRYESGREGDAPEVCFSPRASSIAFYLASSFKDRDALLKKLGKHRAEKACIHIKMLADVDTGILLEMISRHVDHIREAYPGK